MAAVTGVAATVAYLSGHSPAPGGLVILAVAVATTAVLVTQLDRRDDTRRRYKARASLATQQRLRGIIEETGMGFWETEPGGSDVYISATYTAMLGMDHDPDKPLDMGKWVGLIHPDDIPKISHVIQAVGQTREGSSLYRIDYRARHADGHYVWVLSLGAVAERHADGSPALVVGTLTDITEQKNIQLALAASEASFRSLFEHVPVGIALTDLKSRAFLNVNDALLQATGYSREEMLGGMRYEDLCHETEDTYRGAAGGQREQEFLRNDGTRFPALVLGNTMVTSEGREVMWSIIHDMSERKEAERALAHAASHDRLTGLSNRTHFALQLANAISRVERRRQRMLAVLFVDFDRFKIVNDALGHQAGDELLMQISGRLRSALHETRHFAQSPYPNQLARFGGDEFVILLNDVGSAADAVAAAERLQGFLSRPYLIQGREVDSAASIGVATDDTGAASADAIIRNADVAMYEAKRAGGACVRIFSQRMLEASHRHAAVQCGLRQALSQDEFTLVYQPIFDLSTGIRTGVEALLRWHHPVLGPVSPDEFIPIAETNGIIVSVGEWVRLTSLRALARWRLEDPAHAPEYVSVNLSRVELTEGSSLVSSVRRQLAETGMPPDNLQLEITERELMRDPESSLQVMRELRAMGVRLAMDDFGSGTSSLSCLADYPFDIIKIDRHLIQGVSAVAESQLVVRAAAALIGNLGRRSVAEGVETLEQLALCQVLGCDYAQGYLLGTPLAESQVLASAVGPESVEALRRLA